MKYKAIGLYLLAKPVCMASIKKAAVITADIIGSSRLSPARRKKMQRLLQTFFKKTAAQWPDWRAEQYRGDSLQAQLTTNRSAALRIALQLYSYLAAERIHIRISIGIGTISYVAPSVIASDGSAFHVSGAHLDALKKNHELISIACKEENFNGEWQAHSASLHFMMQRWSSQQAGAMQLYLHGFTQEEMAGRLKVSQPAVNQRLQIAGAPIVQKIVARFESVVRSL